MTCEPTTMLLGQGNRGTPAQLAARVLAKAGMAGRATGMLHVLIREPVGQAAAGVWLFYVQHQFEDTHWAEAGQWEFQQAALHGSSHYDLPGVLRWLTGNIGIHHVHHLSSKVPHYRLPEVLRDYPELRDIGRITIPDSLRCVKLVLWDESRRKLVSFREAHAPG